MISDIWYQTSMFLISLLVFIFRYYTRIIKSIATIWCVKWLWRVFAFIGDYKQRRIVSSSENFTRYSLIHLHNIIQNYRFIIYICEFFDKKIHLNPKSFLCIYIYVYRDYAKTVVGYVAKFSAVYRNVSESNSKSPIAVKYRHPLRSRPSLGFFFHVFLI